MLPLRGMGPETLDYYQILEVTPQADQEEIYSAYQKAQATYSLSNPEIFKIFSQEEAVAWMDLIEEAYSVIGSPNSRRIYDRDHLSALPSMELSDTEATIEEPDEPQEGFARTKVSEYRIQETMENAIEKQEVFDGLFLKKIREYKNIDLTDFSKHTCIAIRHLYAIENNNFSVLPAAVFVRGYIIQYCRILSLDEKKVVSSFMSLLNNDD